MPEKLGDIERELGCFDQNWNDPHVRLLGLLWSDHNDAAKRTAHRAGALIVLVAILAVLVLFIEQPAVPLTPGIVR